MKKIVALVLSLVMALSLCTVAFAAGYDLEVTEKFGNDKRAKYDDLKFVEPADDDIYDNDQNVIVTYQKDGKPVYLLRVDSTDPKVNALKSTAVAEHKYVGCGDENDKAPKNCYKDYDDMYWVKCTADAGECVWSDDSHAYITLNGKYDDVIFAHCALVFGEDYTIDGEYGTYWGADAEVVPAGHLMVLVKKNVEYKTSTDGKIVKDVNEYKCYFCNRTFYGSNYQYSTPETADVYSSEYAKQLVNAGFVNVADGVILGDVAYYWTTDKDNGTKADNKGVNSAKTFDAGVAMYVGMSLLSVAGGAVVIGKKKEF